MEQDYKKTLYLLGESSFSRDSSFILELTEEINELFLESEKLIQKKINEIDSTDLEAFEKKIVELRFIRTKLIELTKVE